MGFGWGLGHAEYVQALLDGKIVFKPLLFNIIWGWTFDEFREVGWLGMGLAILIGSVAVFAGMKPRLEEASAKMRRILRDHYLSVKRLFDWIAAVCGLLLLSPVMLLIMVGVKITSRGSVLYRQVRVGRNNIPFMIYKFRSMKIDAERLGAQWATRNDPRVTLIGRFLRRTHLDEVPQLINVLKGEMSLVGPRPERPVFVSQLSQ